MHDTVVTEWFVWLLTSVRCHLLHATVLDNSVLPMHVEYFRQILDSPVFLFTSLDGTGIQIDGRTDKRTDGGNAMHSAQCCGSYILKVICYSAYSGRPHGCVAPHNGRTSVFGRRIFPVLRSTCSWRVTTYVGKPSAIGLPTRPTQPISSLRVDRWVLSCNWMSFTSVRGGAIWWTLTKERQAWCICRQNYVIHAWALWDIHSI